MSGGKVHHQSRSTILETKTKVGFVRIAALDDLKILRGVPMAALGYCIVAFNGFLDGSFGPKTALRRQLSVIWFARIADVDS